MIYFVEMWNAKQSWLDLSPHERQEYMGQVGSAIQGLLDKGVQILTWSENDESTAKRVGYDYLAIWSFPDQEIANGFQFLTKPAYQASISILLKQKSKKRRSADKEKRIFREKIDFHLDFFLIRFSPDGPHSQKKWPDHTNESISISI